MCQGFARYGGLDVTAAGIFVVRLLFLAGGGMLPVCLALALLLPYAPLESGGPVPPRRWLHAQELRLTEARIRSFCRAATPRGNAMRWRGRQVLPREASYSTAAAPLARGRALPSGCDGCGGCRKLADSGTGIVRALSTKGTAGSPDLGIGGPGSGFPVTSGRRDLKVAPGTISMLP